MMKLILLHQSVQMSVWVSVKVRITRGRVKGIRVRIDHEVGVGLGIHHGKRDT